MDGSFVLAKSKKMGDLMEGGARHEIASNLVAPTFWTVEDAGPYKKSKESCVFVDFEK